MSLQKSWSVAEAETRREERRGEGQTFGHWTSDVVMETPWMDDAGGETGVGGGEMGERAKG